MTTLRKILIILIILLLGFGFFSILGYPDLTLTGPLRLVTALLPKEPRFQIANRQHVSLKRQGLPNRPGGRRPARAASCPPPSTLLSRAPAMEASRGRRAGRRAGRCGRAARAVPADLDRHQARGRHLLPGVRAAGHHRLRGAVLRQLRRHPAGLRIHPEARTRGAHRRSRERCSERELLSS